RSLCWGETTSSAVEYETNRKGEGRASQVGEMTGWCRSKRAAPTRKLPYAASQFRHTSAGIRL
ncbi:MAG: hypothetical protein AB7P14_29450, partial [Blastocatellales bacterium]